MRQKKSEKVEDTSPTILNSFFRNNASFWAARINCTAEMSKSSTWDMSR